MIYPRQRSLVTWWISLIQERARSVRLTGPRLMKPFLNATRSATCRSAGCRIFTRNVLVKTSAVVVLTRISPITASSNIVTIGGRRGTSRYSYSAFAASGTLDARCTRLLKIHDGTTIFVMAEAAEEEVMAVEISS